MGGVPHVTDQLGTNQLLRSSHTREDHTVHDTPYGTTILISSLYKSQLATREDFVPVVGFCRKHGRVTHVCSITGWVSNPIQEERKVISVSRGHKFLTEWVHSQSSRPGGEGAGSHAVEGTSWCQITVACGLSS